MNKNFENKVKDFKKTFSKKNLIKKWNYLLRYFEKKQSKFISVSFWIDISLLIIMFFCSIFVNAKTGYYLDSLHFDQYNSLLIPGIVLGSFALILFLVMAFINAMLWVKLYILKKDFKNLLFFVYLSINALNFLMFLLLIIFATTNYRLVFILEIFLIFHTLASLYLYLDDKYDLDFEFIKKMNKKILKSFDKKNHKK
ncbi:MAG: hypothetical protein K2I76_01910 [Malacoplasma sp.]|nr:hypothetical protein [Malacoplasma sp.]